MSRALEQTPIYLLNEYIYQCCTKKPEATWWHINMAPISLQLLPWRGGFISPPLESGLTLWCALTNGLWQKCPFLRPSQERPCSSCSGSFGMLLPAWETQSGPLQDESQQGARCCEAPLGHAAWGEPSRPAQLHQAPWALEQICAGRVFKIFGNKGQF